MKKNLPWLRALAVCLLLSLSAAPLMGCQSPSDPAPETGATTREETTAADTAADTVSDTTADTDAVTEEATTAVPDRAVTIDGTYRIVIAAEADDLTREAADKVAAAFLDKAGLSLTVVTDAEAPTDHELILGRTNRLESPSVADYTLSLHGDSLHLNAESSSALYFAVDAVIEAWLTADFGLAQSGVVTLWESRLVDLNGLPYRLTNSIKILTQNLRDNDDANGNSVAERFERFCLLLADYQPDIIDSQEHSFNWDVRLEKLFKKMTGEEGFPHYAMVGDFSDGPNSKGGGRNAIFYRTDRFELIDHATMWLSETPDSPSTMTPGSAKRTCTWALLKDNQSGQTILVLNTHLDHTSESIRMDQVNVILNYLAANVGDYPVFFTGDFNAGSRSQTYANVDAVLDDSRNTAWRNLSTVSGTSHGYRPGGGGSLIDHVFHNDKATPVTYEILSKDYGGFVSDHYGVLVEFVLE